MSRESINGDKVKTFIQLAGKDIANSFQDGTEEERTLGAQLLLSEVLEYVIYGLGVTPRVEGVSIQDPNNLSYEVSKESPDKKEMLDGLADVAYTMFWNAAVFGIPLEEGYDLVCDNNLTKFVELDAWDGRLGLLDSAGWGLDRDVAWPKEVVAVYIVQIGDSFYAVGKDESGKVRKPAHYESVDLEPLLAANL